LFYFLNVSQIGAEFVGTFILIYAATAGPIVNNKYNGAETLMGNAACAGLTVMFIILSIGHISGAHLNPSLTIAFAAFRHFPWAHVPAYIAAQVSASICACYALKCVYHPFLSGGVTVPTVSIGQAFATEFIITFILLFVVTAVATDSRAVRSKQQKLDKFCYNNLSGRHGSNIWLITCNR
jgi:aquaporin NIP